MPDSPIERNHPAVRLVIADVDGTLVTPDKVVVDNTSKWLPEITLHKLRVGQDTVTVRFWREGDRSRFDVLSTTGSIEVEPSESMLRVA